MPENGMEKPELVIPKMASWIRLRSGGSGSFLFEGIG
jgi:hypothetical protein